MRLFPNVFLLVLVGCHQIQPTLPTVPPGERRVEESVLPQDPKDVVLTGEGDMTEWVEPAEVGDRVEKPGLLISEGYAGRVALLKIGYRELRKLYEADRSVWRVHRELYETRIRLADVAIQELQPSWWDQNKLTVGVGGGFVVGAALVLGLVAALN